MSFEDPDLVEGFIVESRANLEDIEQQFLAVEQNGANVDHELVNTIFRAIHSMKGLAGFMGFNTIQDLAHLLESVLDHVRSDQLVPSSEIVDVMLEAADTLRSMLDDPEASNEADVSEHMLALQSILDSVSAGRTGGTSPATQDATSETTVEGEPAAEVASATPPEAPASSPAELDSQTPSKPVPSTGLASDAAHTQTQPKVETSLRVPISVVDRLMNLVGELVLSRNQLLQSISGEQIAAIKAVGPRINQVTTELQEAVMQTRLQPVGNVFNKFTRIVRDLNKKLNKKCELKLEGADVEIDKSIVEALGDPMTHLVRNALDHAIEVPAERAEKGKPAEGTLLLSAVQEAGSVRITIRDDGAGIDGEKVKQKAVEKGVVTAERAAQMTDREAARLIFEPGFSTAAVVSDVSGRGVGMDVVRTNIEKLGGVVDVDTQVNVGTTITITLPLTLAIMPALIVRNGPQFVAIPQINIGELVRVRRQDMPERIGCIKDAKVLRLRGNLLPLVKLSDIMHTEDTIDLDVEDSQQLPREVDVVVLEMGGTRFGLIAEELLQSEEIVVKPIGRHFADCGCLAGATILGSGDVAMILDVTGIAPQAEESNRGNLVSEEDVDQTDASVAKVLLFRNHPDEQFVMPMSLIVRIEEAEVSQIESVGGQKVIHNGNSSMPLIGLEDVINARPPQVQDYVNIAVFSVLDREVGFIVPEIRDLREVDLESDNALHRENGVMGSIVVDEKPTRILSLSELAQQSLPGWFEDQSEPDAEACSDSTLLIVEDSNFFRKQLTEFFISKGYGVVESEDGEAAWEQLRENSAIDLVVTDLEMPRLDGFGLCQRIKQHPELGTLPVIALTSLTSDEHRQQALACGVDDYQKKMNRIELHCSVRQMLEKSPARLESSLSN